MCVRRCKAVENEQRYLTKHPKETHLTCRNNTKQTGSAAIPPLSTDAEQIKEI